MKFPNMRTVHALLPGYDAFLPVQINEVHVTHVEPLKPAEGRPEACVIIHFVSGVRIIALDEED